MDTQEIDQEVTQKIETTKVNTRTQEQFQQAYSEARSSGQFDDLNEDQLFDKMLLGYKNKGLEIEGINIDEELGVQAPTPEAPDPEITEDKEPGFLEQAI